MVFILGYLQCQSMQGMLSTLHCYGQYVEEEEHID